MIENKIFAGGGLNQDADENFLKPNEWDYALNIRNTDRLENSDGVISNVAGNTPVAFNLPDGTNKCIGNYANEQTGKYYSFLYNSNGYHTITEYDNTTGAITKVLQSKTDTEDNIDILNFQQYELINGVSIIGGNLLYWTDGYNPPRSIDITKAKTGTYYTDSTSISLAKPPPQDLIDCLYANDSSVEATSNRLKNQLFQFRYLYVYEDGSRSAWSSCSEVPLPNLEISNSISSAAYRNNHIDIQFNVGTKFVKSIEIGAQVKGVASVGNTQDWFSILTVDRSVAISSPEYQYNVVDNSAKFSFYNDGLYQSIDIVEIDLPYDYVPLVSKTLDIVNGNVLVVGNNTEGYDNLDIDVNLSTTYESIDEIDRLTFTNFSRVGDLDYIQFCGVPIEGDIVNYRYSAGDPPITYNKSYTVTDADTGSLIAFADNFGSNVQSQTTWNYNGYQQLSGGCVKLEFERPDEETFTLAVSSIVLNAAFNNSSPGYKTNSRYQFGLVYYDEFNRSTYVQTEPNLIVATSSWGASEGKSPLINWEINHSAPTSFTKYQWVRTEQLTHKNFLFWAASSVTANPQNSNFYDLNINTFNAYNTKYPDSILSYEFTPGDRCTIHKDNTTWKTGYDVAVIDYSPSAGVLTIQKKGVLNGGGEGILLEIYTPKTRANQTQEQFFYEFGEVYSCSGGVHSVTSGTFTQGDIYVKGRVITGASGTLLEDPNYSDFYVSNYSSNGRTNIFAPQAKQLNLPTDIRFSDTYVPNTNINGLSRFYGDAYETYDRVNGSIQKLAVRDNYLMTFQELKTGYIPILQSIIEDQGSGNDANVAISNKLLNKIRYFAGDYGIGKHPESFARFAGTMYFADPNRGVIIKLTQGLQPISQIGMDSYFTSKLSYTNNVTNAEVIGSYDPRNDEYIVSFTYPAGGSLRATVAFSEMINRWTTFYSFYPDCGGYIFNQYITHYQGAMYTHNTNSTYNEFYGVNYSSIVRIVYNASPYLIKSFLGVMQQSNTVWSIPGIYTNIPQTSSLESTDFSQKESVWFASLLRDISSPGGLLNGDDLKGNWIKLQLENASLNKISLLAVDVRNIPSYQGIK